MRLCNPHHHRARGVAPGEIVDVDGERRDELVSVGFTEADEEEQGTPSQRPGMVAPLGPGSEPSLDAPGQEENLRRVQESLVAGHSFLSDKLDGDPQTGSFTRTPIEDVPVNAPSVGLGTAAVVPDKSARVIPASDGEMDDGTPSMTSRYAQPDVREIHRRDEDGTGERREDEDEDDDELDEYDDLTKKELKAQAEERDLDVNSRANGDELRNALRTDDRNRARADEGDGPESEQSGEGTGTVTTASVPLTTDR